MYTRRVLSGVVAALCAAAVAAPAADAAMTPEFTTSPALTGEPRVGATLTVTVPETNLVPDDLRNGWLRCPEPLAAEVVVSLPDGCSFIDSAYNQQNYTVAQEDAGFYIGVYFQATWYEPELTFDHARVWTEEAVPAAGQDPEDPEVPQDPEPPVADPPRPVLDTFARPLQARTLRSALAGKTRLGVLCSMRCSLKGKLTVTAKEAKHLGLKSRTVGTLAGSGEGRVMLPIRFTKKAKAALRKHPHPVTITAKVTAGGKVVETFTLKLTAKRR